MQEFLWEIWTGKRNMHHRVQMEPSRETPQAVFRRLVDQLKNSEKPIQTRVLDPNTGKEAELQWRYFWRVKGEESPLQANRPFLEQGIEGEALIVVRPVELRAHTIYIEGFEGLGEEEVAAASSKKPILIFVLAAVLIFGSGAFYFFVWMPRQATVAVEWFGIPTKTPDAIVKMILDLKDVPNAAQPFTELNAKLPAQRIELHPKTRIVQISISAGSVYETWEKGEKSIDDWKKLSEPEKEKRAMIPRELRAKGYFPDTLKKRPPAPKIQHVPTHTPKAITVEYPKRWKNPPRLGLDPMDGGETKGASGVFTQKTSSELALAVSLATAEHLQRLKARKWKIFLSRKDDTHPAAEARNKALRAATLGLQIHVSSGLTEAVATNQTETADGKSVTFNDTIAGYQIFLVPKAPKAEEAQRFSTCLAKALKDAGFLPRPPRLNEATTDPTLGVRPAPDADPFLTSKIPALRLSIGYLSHRQEEAVLAKPETHQALATAIEASLVCFSADQ